MTNLGIRFVSGADTTNSSSGSDNQNKIIEYVATFPNVTVNAGEEYKTCVLPMKTLKLMCVEGTNLLEKTGGCRFEFEFNNTKY